MPNKRIKKSMENIIQDIMLEAWKDSSFQYNYDNGDEFRDLDTPNETEDEYDYLEGGDNLMNKQTQDNDSWTEITKQTYKFVNENPSEMQDFAKFVIDRSENLLTIIDNITFNKFGQKTAAISHVIASAIQRAVVGEEKLDQDFLEYSQLRRQNPIVSKAMYGIATIIFMVRTNVMENIVYLATRKVSVKQQQENFGGVRFYTTFTDHNGGSEVFGTKKRLIEAIVQDAITKAIEDGYRNNPTKQASRETTFDIDGPEMDSEGEDVIDPNDLYDEIDSNENDERS